MSITKEVIDTLHQRIKNLAENSTPDQLAYLAKSLESITDKNAISSIVQMTTVKEIIDVLQRRLKDLAVNSTPDQLAYLAKTLETIVDKSAVSEIAQMADGKLTELVDSAKLHLNDLSTNKENSVSAITAAKTESVNEINTLRSNSLNALKTSSDSHISILDTRKDVNIEAINSTGKDSIDSLKGLVDNFRTVNDVPSGSSIMREVKNRNMIEPGAIPFIFGVLSRKNNYFGHGTFTTELGDWSVDATKAYSMLQLLAGAHEYDMNYVSFYRPKQLCFMEGRSGTFIYGESYVKVINSKVGNNNFIGKYPYAAIGSVFVKNTTNRDINKTVSFVGSTKGAELFVGTPNNTNANKTRISEVKWVSIYRYAREEKVFAASGNVKIPAGRTVAIMLYTLSSVDSRTTINPPSAVGMLMGESSSSYSILYNQFIQWGIHNFRSNFLTAGLEIDAERTLRAWQCPGLTNTYELWQ